MNDAPAVVAIDEQDTHPVDLDRWVDLAQRVLAAENIPGPAELNLTFIDRTAMTELNVEHMGGTGPTDVLSFPLDDDPDDVFAGHTRLLGDIVICPEIVEAQSAANQVGADDPFDAELALMVVHGVLHILGMDHAEPAEAAEMQAREREHLTAWSAR